MNKPDESSGFFDPFPTMHSSVRIDDIIQQVLAYNPGADVDALRKAYVFCAKVHGARTRRPGEPYLADALEIARILARLKTDVATIISGMLYDILEQELAPPEELKNRFGEDIGQLIEILTKLGKITFITSEEQQAENFRKMLLSMARDIRVVLVLLAVRLYNMRVLEYFPVGDQRRFAQETLEIYAPLANRLGISWIKCELEDLAFRYVLPEIFFELKEKVAQNEQERAGYVEEVRELIGEKLRRHQIRGQCYGRYKHLYSIYGKMERQGIEFEQVYDIIAFRVIVETIQDCYAVLGIIHEAWKPIPGRFKDYIAMPKANMYQSLHTTVVGPYGERMEVQIRTEEMHRVAEEGIAAHWKYKEGKAAAAVGSEGERQLGWLRQMLEAQQDMSDSKDFSGPLEVDLFSDEVYVFTPKGEVKAFPRGATTIDFAYSVHSQVGNRCVGARINGKLVPLKTEMKNGDIIEVITSPHQTPSKDWLKFVKTSRAAGRIRQWIKTEQRERNIELGRELLEKRLRKYGCSLKKVQTGKEMAAAMAELGYHTADDLLAAIGYGKLSLGQVVSRVVPAEKLKPAQEEKAPAAQVSEKTAKKPSSTIKIQGIDDVLVRFGKCCNPLPGDPIVGFITRGRGITVHNADCPAVAKTDPDRQVEVEWDLKKKTSHPAKIRVSSKDQKGILANISSAVSNCEANIVSAQVSTSGDGRAVIIFSVDVADLEQLNRVINSVHQVKGVFKVERMRH
ncbi:MAG: bifunctional (p)ppGpp synthetase/guanosine-3',5'-bis(diphosphate) 3'-pyrophosphohydrolase [Syntrophotaleaceae bacterium]